MAGMIRSLARQVWAILIDNKGGIGDAVMEVAIMGAGAQSVFTSVRGGMSTFAGKVTTQFSGATIP